MDTKTVMRVCRRCEELKPHYPYAYHACKKCYHTKITGEQKEKQQALSRIRRQQKVKEYRVKRREDYRLHKKRYDLKQYGLTQATFDAMFASQGSGCAACGDTNSKRWVVDHDHKRNWTRAILCCSCNRTIGHAKEDEQRLLACANYLGIANECHDVS